MLIFKDNYALITLGNPTMANVESRPFWVRLAKDLDNCELHGFRHVIITCNIEDRQHERKPAKDDDNIRELIIQSISNVVAYPGTIIFAGSGQILGRLFEIALACTFRIGTDHSAFGFDPTFGVASPPIDLSLNALRRLIGPAKASKMIMLRSTLTAKSAFALGLLSELVVSDRLESSAGLLAQRASEPN